MALWRSSNPSQFTTFEPPGDPAGLDEPQQRGEWTELALGPQGRWAAILTVGSGELRIISLDVAGRVAGSRSVTLPGARLIVGDESGRITVGDSQGAVRLIDPATGSQIGSYLPTTGERTAPVLAVASAAGLLAVRTLDHVRVHAADGTPLFRLAVGPSSAGWREFTTTLAFSSDGRHLGMSGLSGQIDIYDLDTLEAELRSFGLGW